MTTPGAIVRWQAHCVPRVDACYFLNPTTNLAEIAFMIAPDFQGAGLGTALLACLQENAMNRGVRGFVFEILSSNISMLRLAERARGTVTMSRDEDVVQVTVLFPDTPARAPGSRRMIPGPPRRQTVRFRVDGPPTYR